MAKGEALAVGEHPGVVGPAEAVVDMKVLGVTRECDRAGEEITWLVGELEIAMAEVERSAHAARDSHG